MIDTKEITDMANERDTALRCAAEAYVAYRMRDELHKKHPLAQDGSGLAKGEAKRLDATAAYLLQEFERVIDTQPGLYRSTVNYNPETRTIAISINVV